MRNELRNLQENEVQKLVFHGTIFLYVLLHTSLSELSKDASYLVAIT